jgi:hypothetical protein
MVLEAVIQDVLELVSDEVHFEAGMVAAKRESAFSPTTGGPLATLR